MIVNSRAARHLGRQADPGQFEASARATFGERGVLPRHVNRRSSPSSPHGHESTRTLNLCASPRLTSNPQHLTTIQTPSEARQQ